MTTVGFFAGRNTDAEELWNQCDGSYGVHGRLQFRPGDKIADHLFFIGLPDFGELRDIKNRLLIRLARWQGGAGSHAARRVRRAEHWFASLGRKPEEITVLFYEPPTMVADSEYALARRFARTVYGPDSRATHQITLPVMWRLAQDRQSLLTETPPVKTVPLACVTSGKSFLAGHRQRLGFISALRAAGVQLELFGMGLPADLSPRGPVRCKSTALRPARLSLAIENEENCSDYVSEKLWDPLLCWSLPLYFGPGAPEKLLPPDSFIRIPDLSAAGVEVVRKAVATPGLWERSLPQIAEARGVAMGTARMVELIHQQLCGRYASASGAGP